MLVGAEAIRTVRRYSWGLLLALFAIFVPVCATAAEPSSEPAIDPQAMEIVQRASAHLSQMQRFRYRAEITHDVAQESGQKLQFGVLAEVSARRPDRVLVSLRRDDGTTRRVWYDGKQVTLAEDAEKVYGTVAVPDTLDTMLDTLENEGLVRLPLSDLLYNDLSFLWARATSGMVVGESTVGGVPCYHLAFRNDDLDWQLWIETGDKPLFRKLVITYTQRDGQPQFAARLKEWDLDPALPDERFVFTPPPGFQKIRFLTVPPPIRGAKETEK
jgi:hypothetical protein